MLTTHFFELCDRCTWLEKRHMRTLEPLTYTYEFAEGVCRIKGGVHVLKELGFPASIIDCAKRYV